MKSQSKKRLLLRLFTFLSTVSIHLVGVYTDVISYETQFWLFTAILTSYVTLEILLFKRSNVTHWLLAPPVLASCILFFFNHGPLNIWLLDWELRHQAFAYYNLHTFRYLAKLIFLVILAALAMWVGYSSRIGQFLANRLKSSNVFVSIIQNPPNAKVQRDAAIFFFGLSILARLVLIWVGGYGYIIQESATLSKYSRYFALLSGLGLVVLIALSLEYFSQRRAGAFGNPVFFFVVLATEVFLGFLSGFKSAVITPFVAVGVSYYTVYRQVSFRHIFATLIALFVAYVVIQPFRVLYHQGSFEDLDSTDQLVSALATAATLDDDPEYGMTEERSIPISIVQRLNMTVPGARAIKAAESRRYTDTSRAFRTYPLFSPIYAFIPRFIWPDKPALNPGRWFVRDVLKINQQNNIMFTSFGYLYIAGGITTVLFGFLFIGVLHRIWYEAFLLGGAGGILIFICTVPSLVRLKSSLHALPVHLFRVVPLLLVVQYVLFSSKNN